MPIPKRFKQAPAHTPYPQSPILILVSAAPCLQSGALSQINRETFFPPFSVLNGRRNVFCPVSP